MSKLFYEFFALSICTDRRACPQYVFLHRNSKTTEMISIKFGIAVNTKSYQTNLILVHCYIKLYLNFFQKEAYHTGYSEKNMQQFRCIVQS